MEEQMGHKKMVYSNDTFNLHESGKWSHQTAIGINTCPGAGDQDHTQETQD